MLCFRDTTYCASPDCENVCGRKMSEEVRQIAVKSGMPISYSFFCGEVPEEERQAQSKRTLNNASTERPTD